MTFLAPLWLAFAAVIGVGVVAAHLLTTSVPPTEPLPTVRFIPETTPTAVLRSRRVSDPWLLGLRLLAVALLGLALAGARVRRSAPPRVVLVDRSRAVGSIAEVLDSARSLASPAAVVVAFDSVAKAVGFDSLRAVTPSDARGSMSAAIAAAHRALADVPDDRGRSELVIVSPMVREEIDTATGRLVALWEGPVRVVPVTPATAAEPSGWEIRASGDDPVSAALASIPRGRRGATARVVRTLPTSADSTWARDSGGVLILWPNLTARDVLLPRSVVDSAGGIAAGLTVVIGTFERAYRPRDGRVVARWIDGAPAASERALGKGCVREVAIPVEPVGDLALRESFRDVVRQLLDPCGGPRDFGKSSGQWAVGSGEMRPQHGSSQPTAQSPRLTAHSPQPGVHSLLPVWLAAVAALVLLIEHMLRGRGRVPA